METLTADYTLTAPVPRLLRPLACNGCDHLCDRQVISALIDHGLIDAPKIDRPAKLPIDFPEPDKRVGEDSVHRLTRGCPDPAGEYQDAIWAEKTVRLYILPRYAEVLEARRQAKASKKTQAHQDEIAELTRQATTARKKARAAAAALRNAKEERK